MQPGARTVLPCQYRQMTKSWMLDEFAHAGREHLDPAFVAKYDRKQGADPVDDLAVLRRHGLDATSTLLDFGAGTGRLALSAAPMCRRVVAADVSPRCWTISAARSGGTADEHRVPSRLGLSPTNTTGHPSTRVHAKRLHQLPDFWKAVALDAYVGCSENRRRLSPPRSDL